MRYEIMEVGKRDCRNWLVRESDQNFPFDTNDSMHVYREVRYLLVVLSNRYI